MDEKAARELRRWARANGMSDAELGEWTTRADVIAAYDAAYLDGRPGTWHAWGRAVRALVDD